MGFGLRKAVISLQNFAMSWGSAMEHVQALVFNHKHENQENPVCQEVLCFSSGTVA